jgi:hypothetical protein
MKNRTVAVVMLALPFAGAIAGYLLGQSTAAKNLELRHMYVYAESTKTLQVELGSSDPQQVENALWLTLGDLRSLEKTPNAAMPADLAAMETALTYVKLAGLASAQQSEARVAALMKQAVAACQRTTSPNCNAEALSLMVRHRQASAPSTK